MLRTIAEGTVANVDFAKIPPEVLVLSGGAEIRVPVDACFREERAALETLHYLLVNAGREVGERISQMLTPEERQHRLAGDWLQAVSNDPLLIAELHNETLRATDAPEARMRKLYARSGGSYATTSWVAEESFVRWVAEHFAPQIHAWEEAGRPKLFGAREQLDDVIDELEGKLIREDEGEDETPPTERQ